jgi:hypothetical protein
MKTRDALRQITGRHHDHGDGPLANVGRQLLQNFQARETQRLADADERAFMAGKGPVIKVLQQKLAEARAADLFQDGTPCVSRFEAYQALDRARGRHPTDRGLRMASAHAERLWHKDRMGYLTVGDVARLRGHYTQQYPRSVVAKVIDSEIPRVGFNTLPVAKLGQMAAQIVGNTDEERQFAYEQVIQANGLHTNKPEHMRARAFIRSLADMAAEPPLPQDPRQMRGEDVAQRALMRMAAYDDPILSRVGQVMEPAPEPMAEPAMPPVEQEVPHEEETEVIEEATSPITGEPMVVELGAPEEEPGDMAGGGEAMAPTQGPEELAPEFVASLHHFGQLDDYADDELGLEGGEGEPIDMIDETPDETSITMEDPTAPGEMLEVTFQPTEEASEVDMGGEIAPPMPGMDNMASRQPRHVFAVYAARGGVIHSKPLERVRAHGMPAMLRRVAKKLREADGVHIPRAVLADQDRSHREAIVVLDHECGNFLVVRAEQGDEFSPEVVSEGQPVVQHNLQLSDSQGREVLVEEKDLSQNKPAPVSEEDHPTADKYEVSAKKLTPKQVKAICKKMGLTAAKIEAAVLDGRDVVVGPARLTMNDAGDVEFYRGTRGRVASLMDLDTVIKDFMVYAAMLKPKKAGKRTASFHIRALFTVGCGRCGYLGEYCMPDTPQNVKCAGCGWVTPPEAIAIQLESRQATAFPGYVITTDIPGKEKKERKYNARRMLSAIKQIAPTNGALIRQGQLEFVVRNVNEAGLNRIRRVLEDTFGVRGAQMVPAQAPAVNMLGTPTQHATQPMQPTPQQPMQPSVSPMGQPTSAGEGVTQLGTAGQHAQIQQHADPGDMPQVSPARPRQSARQLPVGPGIKHVHIKYADGRTAWMPIEAASDVVARQMIASFMDGSEVLEVIDSQRRAQMDPMEQMPAEAGPADAMGMDMTGPGGAENVETAGVDPKTEETIRAAMLHYRNTGVGIAEATDSFVNNYGKFLDRYGDKTSPARHLIEAAVIRIAKEVYEQPALVQQQSPVFAALSQKQGWHLKASKYLAGMQPRQRAAAWGRIAAEEPKGPTPRQINEQQDDWVNLGEGDAVLGPDSDTGEGFQGPKVNTQVDTIAIQPGSEGADTSQQPDTETNDPKRFDAPKPDSDGHVFTPPGEGWGTAYTDDDFGSQGDSQTGENEETSSWDGVADDAYSNVRSQ